MSQCTNQIFICLDLTQIPLQKKDINAISGYLYKCKLFYGLADNTLNTGCGIWTRAGQKCYMFYQDPPSSWSDAKKACQSINGDLVNVKDHDTKVSRRRKEIKHVNDVLKYVSNNCFLTLIHCFMCFKVRNQGHFVLLKNRSNDQSFGQALLSVYNFASVMISPYLNTNNRDHF